MTKEQKADALLKAARDWQKGFYTSAEVPEEQWSTLDADTLGKTARLNGLLDIWASAALTDAAALGFDIVNSDGSDCEKVAEVDRVVGYPVLGTKLYIMRKVLK
jgi:hypothetical protein